MVALTWGFAVFLVLKRRRGFGWNRRAFACVPSQQLEAFLRQLDAGSLDPLMRAYLSSASTGRTLARREQATSPGLFDVIGLRRALLAIEPEVEDLRLVPIPAVA